MIEKTFQQQNTNANHEALTAEDKTESAQSDSHTPDDFTPDVTITAPENTVRIETGYGQYEKLSSHQKLLEASAIGAQYLHNVKNLFFSLPRTENPIITKKVTIVECADNQFFEQVFLLSVKIGNPMFLVEGHRVIDLIAGTEYKRQNVQDFIKKSAIVCLSELDRVSDNGWKNALADVLLKNFKGAHLILHARKIDRVKEIFQGTYIGDVLKSADHIKIDAIEPKNVISWENFSKSVNITNKQVLLPVLLGRLGLFSSIDSKERAKLTEETVIEVDGVKYPYTLEKSAQRVYSLNGFIVEIDGPVLCVDMDLRNLLFLLSELLRSSNSQGSVETTWAAIVKGFDLSPKKGGANPIKARKRSITRLTKANIKITDPKSKLVIYHGGFISDYHEEKRGRFSKVIINFPQSLASELLQHRKVKVEDLQLPQFALAVSCYIKSNDEVFDMSLGKWSTIVGRDYSGYTAKPKNLKENLRSAFKLLEERKIIKSGWKIKDDKVTGIKACGNT